MDTPLEIDATRLTPAGLVDASFERDPPAWISPGRAGAAAVRMVDSSPRYVGGLFRPGHGSDHPKDGAAWLRMTAGNDGDSIAQDLERPLAGTTYTFSAWVRAAPAATEPVSGHLRIRALGGSTEETRTAFRATEQWALVTTTLSVRSEDHRGLQVDVGLASAGTTIDVDGTRLTGANPELPASGGDEL